MAEILPNYAADREAMVERQIAGRGINDDRILQAFLEVPREAFVGEKYADLAYSDQPLPIEAGQTISQPYIVALMMEAADIRRGDKVLEVGAGSGYAAALMSRIARQVIAIERHGDLAEAAARRLRRLGYDNVRIIEGDGSRGCAGEAPFDAILAAATGRAVPDRLVEQLAPGGRLVMPIGAPRDIQKLVKVTIGPVGQRIIEELGSVRFVPLVGEEGWDA